MNKKLRFLRRLPLGLALALAVSGSHTAYAQLKLSIGGSSDTCPANTSCPNTSSGGGDTGSHSCGPSNTGQPCEAKVGNPINVITGNKYQEETDLPALPGVLGLKIVRHYNSGLSRPTDPNGLLGRGWRLSYETELFAIGNTVQVLQADGRRLIFNRDAHNPSLCATPNPAHGQIAVTRTSRGNAYLWTQPGGNKLLFDEGGKLVQIQAPTGEFVSLHYDRQQRLDQVTDPQGRSLHLRYPAARSFERFRGIQAIDSPVGRFVYEYGSPMPRDGNLDRQRSVLANLVKVTYPQDGSGKTASRLYHYEDPSHLTLLTGMSVAGTGSDGRVMNQRIATWSYDAAGRAILSTHADGVEKVTLDYRQPGQTTITNSLNQQTTYRHAIVGGEFRLLEVRGPGCASCGETNVKYGYDKLGRLIETTRLDEQGRPLLTVKTELDPYGRPLKVGRIAYRNGHAQPAQWQLRYEYDRTHWKPVVIARPSVVPGQEMVTRMTYNGQDQPLSIVETGLTPAWGGKSAAASMARELHYRYNNLNLRVETDGPLPNAQRNPGPDNSDIARTDYNPDTKLPVRTVAPGNVITEVLERDTALRPARIRTTDGATEQVATLRHNWRGQPESITIEAVRLVTGKDGQRHADPASKLARTLRYQYDANGRLTGITQPGNLTTRFEYDAAGRLAQRLLPDGSRIAIARDSEDRVHDIAAYADVADKAISRITYGYDDLNRIAQIGDGEGVFQRYRYTGLGQIAAATNALGMETQFTWDDSGFLTFKTQAAGTTNAATVKLGYDSHGQPTAVTDPNGVTTQRYYDDFNRKIAEANPDRGVALYRYDAAGRLIAKIDETGITTRYRYDAANRLLALGADKEAELVRYRYEGLQLAEVVGTPDGKAEHASERTSYERNAFGQVVKEVRWIGKADGKPLDNSSLRFITRSAYDEAGRLVEQVLPDGHRLDWRYTPAADEASQGKPGQLNAILFDGKEIVTGIEQTQTGGLSGYVNGNGIRQSIRLDGRGRIVQLQAVAQNRQADQHWWSRLKTWLVKADAAPGKVVYHQTNRYDAANRLTEIEREETGPNLAQASVRRERYGYDRLDRLTGMESGGRITHLRYDRGGNRVAEDDGMDKAQPTRVAALQDMSREESGQRVYRYAPGTNRLIGIIQAQQEGQAARAPQTKEEAAQWIRSGWLYHATGVPLARLEAAAPAGSRRTVYNGDKRPVAVYDAQNRLISRYRYNLQGERIAKTVYEAQPAMRQAALQGGKEREQTSGRTTYSLYRDQRLAAEADGEGRITAHYVYLNGMPVAKIETVPNTSVRHTLWKAVRTLGGMIRQEEPQADDSVAEVYAIHTDQRGAPQAVTDETQRMVWQADTDAFGKAHIRHAAQTAASGRKFEMNLRLPGQVFDEESGLHYNYYRDYDPSLGRYTTPDPLGLGGGMNPYAYVANNPLTNIDPLGLYESDIHYYTTFFLAMAAGIDRNDARRIALAAQYVDDNPLTTPMPQGLSEASMKNNHDALLDYHFTLPGGLGAETMGTSSTQLDNLENAAKTAAAAKNRNGCLQFVGEYLHAFEDTFSHRDPNNGTFDPIKQVNVIKWLFIKYPEGENLGVGHGLYGHDPDYTYNHTGNLWGEWSDADGGTVNLFLPPKKVDWTVNEDRTLKMEQAVFNKLLAYGDKTKAKNWTDFEKYMKEFNAIAENEDNTDKGFPKKLAKLQEAFAALDIDGIDLKDSDKYLEKEAESNRNDSLKGLDQSDYKGTLLSK